MRERLKSGCWSAWQSEEPEYERSDDKPTARNIVAAANALAESVWDDEEMPTRPAQRAIQELAEQFEDDQALERLTPTEEM